LNEAMMDRWQGFHNQALETRKWADRRAFQEQKFQRLLPQAARRAPAIRRRLKAAGIDPGGAASADLLHRIPVTRKAELMEVQKADPPFGGFLAVPPGELKRIYVSPGPVYDPLGRNLADNRCETTLYAAGIRPGDVVQNCFLYHMTPFGLYFDDALVNLGCVVVPAGVGNTDLQAQIMRQLAAKAFLGTPSFLKTILDKVVEQGFDPRKDLAIETAVVGAEMLPASLRAEIEDLAGIKVIQAFGTADVGLIGHECPHQNGYHLFDELIIQICDPDTGDEVGYGTPGEMVVTSLNDKYPIIRLGVGDLVIVDDEPCPCGRTAPRLTQILGRIDMLTKVRGQFIHPVNVGRLVEQFPEAARGRAVVERVGHQDSFVLEIEPSPGVSPDDDLRGRIEAAAREIFRLRAEVTWVEPGRIDPDSPPIVDRRKWD
jgi:phenylacetate-CoA ligase